MGSTAFQRSPDYPGTANALVGHRLREGKPRSAAARSALPRGPDEPDWEARELTRAHEQEFQKILAEKRFEKKIVARRVRDKIELGLEAYDDLVDERRDKLRLLLLQEDLALTRELVDKSRELEQQRIAELSQRALEAAREQEAAREALAQEKLTQYHVENSRELRERLSRALFEDSKRANLAQIEDHERRRRESAQQESFWAQVTRTRIASEAEKLTAEQQRREALSRQVAEVQRQQMALRAGDSEAAERVREAERREMAQLRSAMDDERMREAHEAAEKRRRYVRGLEQQLEEARGHLEERRREQEALDRLPMALLEDKSDPGDWEAKARRKRQMRREVLGYMEEMQRMRAKIAARERETDQLIHDFAERERERQLAERTRRRAERAQAVLELKDSWAEQLSTREEQARLARRERELAQQLLAEESGKLAEEEFHRRARGKERARNYAGALSAQAQLRLETEEYLRKLELRRAEEEAHRESEAQGVVERKMKECLSLRPRDDEPIQ